MDIKTYISDSLLQLTGVSDPTVVDFVLATASKAKSQESLREQLGVFLDGGNADIQPFCTQLWSRVNPSGRDGKSSKDKPAQQPKKKYRLVEMEDEIADNDLNPSKPQSKESGSSRPRSTAKNRSDGSSEYKKRDSHADGREHNRPRKLRRIDKHDFESRWGDEEPHSGEDELYESPEENLPDKDNVSDVETFDHSEEDPEKARERDRRERDEFAKRLISKDDKRSRQVIEDRSSKKDGGTASRRALAEDSAARAAAMPDLRLRSRQDYLKKREAERLALLRKQVAEETAELRENPDLTQQEKEEFAKNREVLRLTEERLQIDDHRDGYFLPEDYITEKGKLDRKRKKKRL
ncbi:mRNA splicing factor RNA helicase (Cdc28), partial [Trichophyton tonsurans CBS 112818]